MMSRRHAIVSGKVVAALCLSLFLLARSSGVASATPESASHESASHESAIAGEHAHEGVEHEVHGAPPVNWTDIGWGDKDVDGNKLKKGAEPMVPPFIFALINFALFGMLLYFKAGPALTKYLGNRHDSIKGALDEAAKLQEEAREKLAEYSKRIADADAEVAAVIEQIRNDAETERKLIVADAEQQAARMRKDAEARIETEFLAARRMLEREVVAKAAETAERILSEKASAADHDVLFSNFIADLKSGSVSDEPGRNA